VTVRGVILATALAACTASPTTAPVLAVPKVGPAPPVQPGPLVSERGTCVAFDETGARVAIGAADGSVTVRSATQVLGSWPGLHHGNVSSVALAGKRLASAGADGVRVTDVTSGARLAEMPAAATAVTWSPSGDLLAVTADGGVRIYDAPGVALRAVLREDAVPTVVAWRGDDDALAVGDASGSVDVVRARAVTPVARFRLHGKPISSLDWSADGATLLTATGEGGVALWDATRADLSRDLRMPGGPTRASAALCDDSVLVADGRGPVRRIALGSGEETPTTLGGRAILRSPGGAVATMSDASVVVADGVRCERAPAPMSPLASRPWMPHMDETGLDDEQSEYEELGTLPLEAPRGAIAALAWSPDGRLLAATVVEAVDEARVWNTATGERVRTLTREKAETDWDIAFDASSARIAVTTRGGGLSLFDPDGHLTGTVPGRGGDEATRAAFSPDGRAIARSRLPGAGGGLEVLRATGGNPSDAMPTCRAGAIAWPGALTVRCADGKSFEAWSPGTRHLLRRIRSTGVAGWSADGRLVVDCVPRPPVGHRGKLQLQSDDRARDCHVRDLVRGEDRGIIRAFVAPHSLLALDPTGRRIAVAYEGRVKLWEVDDRDARRSVRNPPGDHQLAEREVGTVRAMAWSPDGTRCAIGTGDGWVRVWDAGGRGWTMGGQ
jgi:WD40 repeat protein